MPESRNNRERRRPLHLYRVAVFAFIVLMIHQQHRWYGAQQRGAMKERVSVEQVRPFYQAAKELSDWNPAHGGQTVIDANGKSLGYVVQTSPDADAVIGFSGPSNTMVAFDANDRVLGISILRSGDTREHEAKVREDKAFMAHLNDRTWAEAAQPIQVDGVSGATLTSMAIADGIAIRLGGGKPSSRFPNEISLVEVQPFLETARRLRSLERRPDLLEVLDANATTIGYVGRTSPHADSMMGYQGPTDALIVLNPKHRVTGLAIRQSFDNEPYVRYLKEDEYFFNIFKGKRLEEIAKLNMVDAGIEGVSGATMTSSTVAGALIHAAGELIKAREETAPQRSFAPAGRDLGTLLVIVCGFVIALTRLRGNRRLRILFQVALVVYLGFINADMLSQALLVGWAQNGIAWRGAPALAALTVAALLAPMLTGRQVYCSHLCPYGAMQDWLRRVGAPRIVLSQPLRRLLAWLPGLLLLGVVLVAMQHLPFGLVDIEPFDAYVVKVAGWSAITIAIVGLVASLFIPMAYCRYGCPTGAMLKFLRLGAASERFGPRDVFATILALVAFGLYLL